MYANVRGIKGKRCSLIEHLDFEKPDIVLLTETLLPTNMNMNFPGFDFFSKARKDRKGGGVAILVKNDLKNTIIPHISERNIEMMWISIRRHGNVPLFLGCYYGKQERRCNKADIDEEMNLLSEEIEQYQKEGDLVISMDGNGKVGLLGEKRHGTENY